MHEATHHRHLNQRANDGSKRGAGVEAKDGHGNRQRKVVAIISPKLAL